MGTIEPRYAEALYNAAPPAAVEPIAALLSEFSACMTRTPALKQFLFNPSIPMAIRKETALKLLPPDAPKEVGQFLSLLIDRKRLPVLPGICVAYNKIVNRALNRLSIQVTSAKPLEQAQLNQIRDKYLKKYGARSAVIEQTVDPGLLGGMRIQIGDKVIDQSLRARINDLHRTLIGNVIEGDVAQWA